MTEKKEIRVYKLRFIVFMLLFTCLLFFFLMLMRRTFSSYVSDANIEITSNYAAYIFETERLNFNLETDGIIPSDTPYVYQFTVSNFNDIRKSDVDLSYQISIRTTTNLPLTYRLYYEQNYNEAGSENIIDSTTQVQDEDGAWYHQMTVDDVYTMPYTTNTTHTFYLVVDFPIAYSSSVMYEGMMDNIEITIDSKQIVS